MDLRGAWLAVVLACAFLPGAAGCEKPAAPTQPSQPVNGVDRLVDLASRRLSTADTVAAAKWRTGGAIADPAREKVVLDNASGGATRLGLDPRDVAAVFRDQIEANKAVQYGLFSDWSAEPSHVPPAAADLGQVRPVLDRITSELLDALAAAQTVRRSAQCATSLRRAIDDAERDQHLDGLHRHALNRAVSSVCR